MKKYFIIITTFLLISAFEDADTEHRFLKNSCKNEKYATPEPGTCLTPKAYRFLNTLDKVEKNPYDNKIEKKLLNLLEPRIYKTENTKVHSEEFDIPIRIYYPTKASMVNPTQIVLFIHGGGFMFGSIEEYDMAVKKFAKVSEMIIVSIDYRLAPEFPFPAAVNDANAVLHWISENSIKIGGLNNKIVVMGDSAGANIAAVLAIKNRDDGKNIIAAQILYYPPTTFVEAEFPSRVYFLRDSSKTYLLTEDFLRLSKRSYLPDSSFERNPYASPLEARLTGILPPAFIINAQVDPLRDDGRLYAERLQQSGHEVLYKEYPGITHGFFNFYMIFNEAKQSMKLVRDFIETEIGKDK